MQVFWLCFFIWVRGGEQSMVVSTIINIGQKLGLFLKKEIWRAFVVCLVAWLDRSPATIYNGYWTEWSAIWAEIIRVVSKSNKRAAWVRFEITSMISDQNYTTRGSITTLLHPFWNRPNTGLSQFKYFIDAVLSRFEIKFIHFLRGKNESFRNKSCKICHMILCLSSLEIWLVVLFLV